MSRLAWLLAVFAAMGWLSFRCGLRGSCFAPVALAFAAVFRILANPVWRTGAGEGIPIPFDSRPSNLQFADLSSYCWLLRAIAPTCFPTVRRLGRSRFGARLMAVRDNLLPGGCRRWTATREANLARVLDVFARLRERPGQKASVLSGGSGRCSPSGAG